MLRLILVFGVLAVGFRYFLKGPFYGLLLYLWIAYFRPQEWLWNPILYTLNPSFFVGIVLVFATIFSSERLRGGVGAVLFFAVLVQSLISTLLSPVFSSSWALWLEFAKCLLISYLIVVLVSTEARLRLTILTMAFSLGFEGAKQGWAQLVQNPGAMNANRWPMLGDNNGVAVGMLMLIPLLVALARTSTWKFEKYLDRFLAVGVVYRAISTSSRGGFLAAGALALHYTLRSRRKVVATIALLAVAGLVTSVLPDEFWSRMGTIQTAAQSDLANPDVDASSAGRLHFWQVAMVMANERPLMGVGLGGYNAVYDQYDFSNGQFGSSRSVHSSWFGVVSELGYPGLFLFTVLIVRGFLVCRRARRAAKTEPRLAALASYATAIEAGLIVFAVGGAFVPFHYTELLWHSLALTFAIDRLISEPALAPAAATSKLRPLAV